VAEQQGPKFVTQLGLFVDNALCGKSRKFGTTAVGGEKKQN
jgi:hypothetical protein